MSLTQSEPQPLRIRACLPNWGWGWGGQNNFANMAPTRLLVQASTFSWLPWIWNHSQFLTTSVYGMTVRSFALRGKYIDNSIHRSMLPHCYICCNNFANIALTGLLLVGIVTSWLPWIWNYSQFLTIVVNGMTVGSFAFKGMYLDDSIHHSRLSRRYMCPLGSLLVGKTTSGLPCIWNYSQFLTIFVIGMTVRSFAFKGMSLDHSIHCSMLYHWLQ
jgi:hypothetical protein